MKKPKRGRPPKEPGELHDESLLVRMRSEEKQALREAAELSGESLSDWVRLRLKQIATKELKRASHLIVCLMVIGSVGIATARPRQEKAAAKKPPGVFQMVTPRPKAGSIADYEDRSIGIEFTILTRLAFKLSNKAKVPIEIDWDRASYVDVEGRAHRVFHNGVRFAERDKPQAHTVVPPGATLDDLVHPTDYVSLEKLEWQMKELFTIIDVVNPDSPLKKGKSFQLLLPIKIGSVLKNYQFVFRLAD